LRTQNCLDTNGIQMVSVAANRVYLISRNLDCDPAFAYDVRYNRIEKADTATGKGNAFRIKTA